MIVCGIQMDGKRILCVLQKCVKLTIMLCYSHGVYDIIQMFILLRLCTLMLFCILLNETMYVGFVI